MIALDETFKYRKRHQLSPITTILDIADYKVGWIFSMRFVKILKLKVSKIMDSPRYLIVISIFNIEYVVSR
jgi:hypothetical protein